MKKGILILVCLAMALTAGLWANGGSDDEAAVVMEGVNSNPLSDYRVRQAIAYAIDMEQIADTLLEGKALVADSLIPNGPWKPAGLESYSYNPAMAKELLKDAGWDSNYVLDVVFYYGDQTTVDIMTAVQSYLQAVGMQMTFRKLEGDVGDQLWTKALDPVDGPSYVTWDLAYAGSAALAMHEYFGKFPTGGPGNSHTPGTAELDELIAATKATADIAGQKAAFADLQVYMNEYLPAIPLYYQQLFVFESEKVNRNGGSYGNAQFNYDWGILDWTVEPDDNGKQVLQTITGPEEFFEHPWFNPGITMDHKTVFDRLLVADGSMAAKGGQLAKSYEVADDGMSISFVLNDVTWHDGKAMTLEDIKWSVEYSLKIPAVHSVIASTFNSLEGAEAYMSGAADEISGVAISGDTITFKFAKLDPNMMLTFSQFSPLPKSYFEGDDPLQFQQNSFWQSPIGNGPFRIKEVRMNDYTVLEANPDYYGGTPKIDEIVMYPGVGTEVNIVKNAEAGLLDYGFTKSVPDVKALEAMDHMRVTAVDIPYTRLFYVNKFPKE